MGENDQNTSKAGILIVFEWYKVATPWFTW